MKTHRDLRKTSKQIRLIDLHSIIGPFPLHGQIFSSCKLAWIHYTPSAPVSLWQKFQAAEKPLNSEQFYQTVIEHYKLVFLFFFLM